MISKVAFVTPWYGPKATGGAETETRRTAEHLAAAGLDVEVLATCVRDFRSDWADNHHAPGKRMENGVLVRRFRADRRDREAFDAVNRKLMVGLPVSADEAETYVRENIHSAALIDYVAKRCSERSEHLFIFIPYMFGTTYRGLAACKGQAALIPCLHDEPYARLELFRRMFAGVRRLIFHTQAELDLARTLYQLQPDAPTLLGEGVDMDRSPDPAAFRRKHRIAGPFILYAGRKDAGKNVDLLIRWFRRYRGHRAPDIQLVLIGGGPLPVDIGPDEGIRDLGYVSAQDKIDAYGAADLLCQPSLRESFSLVLLEAWAAGTAALVHGGCAVTREHCTRSNGGLYFTGYDEFAACLDLLLKRAGLRKALGDSGQRFVRENYRWDIITDRYRDLIAAINREGLRAGGTAGPPYPRSADFSPHRRKGLRAGGTAGPAA